MSMVTGPAASSAARSAGSRSIIRAVAAARPASAPRHCFPVNRRRSRSRSRPPAPAPAPAAAPPDQHAPGPARPGNPHRPLGRGHPGQHLPAGEPPRPLLDRPHRRIEGLDQAELAAQLGHRDHPARGRQRRVGRPDLDPAAGLARHPADRHHSGIPDAARSSGRWRPPLTRRNWWLTWSIPAAYQRTAVVPSRHRLMFSRVLPAGFDYGLDRFAGRSVRASVGMPRLKMVSVSAMPSRSDAAVPGGSPNPWASCSSRPSALIAEEP